MSAVSLKKFISALHSTYGLVEHFHGIDGFENEILLNPTVDEIRTIIEGNLSSINENSQLSLIADTNNELNDMSIEIHVSNYDDVWTNITIVNSKEARKIGEYLCSLETRQFEGKGQVEIDVGSIKRSLGAESMRD